MSDSTISGWTAGPLPFRRRKIATFERAPGARRGDLAKAGNDAARRLLMRRLGVQFAQPV
jgi:hypothetical protein